MGAANDKKVLGLKTLIAEKKEKLEKAKFVPITNCSIEFEGVRSNIQVLSKDQLTLLLIRLNAYWLSMIDLGIHECPISGYDLRDWITDVKLRVKVLNIKKEEENLRALERKLETLLSDDKKTELELSSIEALLK